MMTLQDVQSNVSELLGLKPKSTLDRLRDLDLRGMKLRNLDLRGTMPHRMDLDLDLTSMLVGLTVGVGVGFAVGWLLKGNVRPALTTVREKAEEALERAQENLPTRLNISRIEETQPRR